MDGVFWGMQEGARPVFHISFNPFSFENDHRFGGLGMAVSGNYSAGGKFPKQESGSIRSVMGKVGELDPGIGAGFPQGGVREADGWKHALTMSGRIRSDNLPS